ncbi:HNH endonuclease signature motif containing protein [Streptomyces sp. BK340]|uniref:HNH endonuclease signature motif containing protein n=1 Tax=Streptomyces sp. BK340 TaxID=2572903 RepID=UPI0011A95B43|nr:HNH endonuclease signature motif containing protein [Streptomyces sp. BK340]
MDRSEITPADVSARAWSFLLTDVTERQFRGNAGYEDVAEESYSYDSTVGNHRRVRAGDLVVVRSRSEALGVGYIEQLDVLTGQKKERRRCPYCRSTNFKERTTQEVRYWCSPCQKAFPAPILEVISVIAYRAHYGGTWQPLEGCLSKADLAEITLSKSDQQSIKAMDLARTLAAVAARGIRMPHEGVASRSRFQRPSVLMGGRRRTIAAARRGQDAFRKALVREYGMFCAVTGPTPAEALEAAHLRPFAVTEQHHVEEGLLLRADIHRLFDSGLLAIGPNLLVSIAPSLLGYTGYRALHGTPLRIPKDAPLNRRVIEEHYTATTETW